MHTLDSRKYNLSSGDITNVKATTRPQFKRAEERIKDTNLVTHCLGIPQIVFPRTL